MIIKYNVLIKLIGKVLMSGLVMLVGSMLTLLVGSSALMKRSLVSNQANGGSM